MKFSPLVLLALLVSCTKHIDAPSPKNTQAITAKPEVCNFGIQVFNQNKRVPASGMYNGKKKKGASNQPVATGATIFLDFDGQVVDNTAWNMNGPINAKPANLFDTEVDKVLERVSEDFSPFNVTVTTDESVYNASNPYKRMRVIVTETWEWFGSAGGISYINSFTWGDNTPCFIFSSLLGYNEKYIAEAISHEVGHTLGLLHQSSYDGSCNFLSEYNTGIGDGLTGWAPIMGVGYYRNITTWHNGPKAYGCNALQDDVAVIASVLGMRPDENNAMNKLQKLTTTADGIMNSSADIDYYFVQLKTPATITVEPNSLGNGEGANLCLKLNIYDRKGVFIKSVHNAALLMASTTLDKEQYYIGIETEADANQSRYGMLGRYKLRLE